MIFALFACLFCQLSLFNTFKYKKLVLCQSNLLLVSKSSGLKNLGHLIAKCLKTANIQYEGHGVIKICDQKNPIVEVILTGNDSQAKLNVQTNTEETMAAFIVLLSKHLPEDVSVLMNPLTETHQICFKKFIDLLLDEMEFVLNSSKASILQNLNTLPNVNKSFLKLQRESDLQLMQLSSLFSEILK